MRTSLLVLVPCILLGGLIWGGLSLSGFGRAPQTCVRGECPLSLHTDDSGKSFVYGTASRFSVFLDEGQNPRAHLQCVPEGVIGAISNSPHAVPPMYAATFEGVARGTCVLSDDHFSTSITIQ